ncbi:hypothetical protein E5676_scaffold64G00230 [Cucumis melo var. makuwa]|uniref:Uncharacterized protein n=1 Tax=Cucumis melo var. makuwa TaxID=1194695 RepID=A0A5D3E0R5_CUCMM|nr:hypothetical protein E5676_scaffold64G00230 [Cucumis melo var. makuwa]
MSDRAPSSFQEVTLSSDIKLLMGNDRAFAVRSIVLVGKIGRRPRLERGDSTINDPTSTGRRSSFCRLIDRSGRSDWMHSSLEEVTPPSAIHLLLGDDQTFAIRSTTLIYRLGRSDRASLLFGEVTTPSVIQLLLLGDDGAFVIASSTLVGLIERLRRLERSNREPSSFGEVTPPSTIQLLLGTIDFCRQIYRSSRIDRTPSLFGEVTPSSVLQYLLGYDRAFAVRFIALRSNFYYGMIELLPLDSLPWLERSSTFVVWRGDFAVSDPISIEGQVGFCRVIHHPGRSNWALSSFGEVTPPSAIQLLLGDNQAFPIRSPSLSDQAPLSLGEVTPSSTIQHLLGDDRASEIHHPSRSDRASSSFGEVDLSSAIQTSTGDDWAFLV